MECIELIHLVLESILVVFVLTLVNIIVVDAPEANIQGCEAHVVQSQEKAIRELESILEIEPIGKH
jgi:hypothetical protein